MARTFQVITHPDDLGPDLANVQRIVSGEIAAFQMEKRYLHARGHAVSVMLNVSLVRDRQGAPSYFISHIQDITERKRGEAALLEREADLRDTQRLAGLGSWSLDVASREIRCSGQTFRILGLDPAGPAPTSASIAAMLNADGVAALEAALRDALDRGTPFVLELEAVRPDGTRRWLVLRGEPVRDAAGRIGAVRGTAFDATERKQAQDALHAADAEFRTLAEAMPQIVWITRADGWVVYFNQRWMDYTGLTLEQSLGEGWTEPFHPQDRQRSWDAWALATRTQGTYSLECRLRRADGEYRWWLTRGAPQRDAAGHVLKWFGTCTDIHDLKMAQESLRLLGSAVEQASESVMITDADMAPPGPKIVFVNPAFTRMTGWTSEEVIGKTPRILQGAGTDRAVLDRLRQDLHHEQVFQGEAVNYRKDGSEFALEWQVAPLRGADGAITNYLAIQRDITARKRAEADLAAAHAQLVTTSRLAGMAEIATNVLHNVGNVLNSVNISATLVLGSVRESRAANLGKVAQLLQEHAQDLGAFLASDALGRRLPEYIGQLAQHLQDEQQQTVRELDSLLHNIDHIKTIVAMQQDHAKGAGARAAP